MAAITLKGSTVHTLGNLPEIGTYAPDFQLTKSDLSMVSLNDYKGGRLILNIFPSIDTGTCAKSVRKFNEEASKLDNTKVLCISKDLPFAQKRFCGAEGISDVELLSDFRDGNFGKNYQLDFIDGPFQGLHSRAVLVLDEDRRILYLEQVEEFSDEPNYLSALEVLQNV